jgi:short-subunit dehydrogenase
MPASPKRGSLHLEQKNLGILVNNAGLGQLFEPCDERLPQAKQMPVRHAQRAVA